MKILHLNATQIPKSRDFLRLTPLALLFVLTMAGQANAQHIITFDAPNAGTGPYQGTEATGINVEGTIAGNVTDSGYATHGFVRTPDGHFTNFDAPNADPVVGCTCPLGINDLGAIVGNYADTNSVNHGFVRTPDGHLVAFDAPHSGTGAYQGTAPAGINNVGAITGNITDNGNGTHGFVRAADGRFTEFDAPGANPVVGGTYPSTVNNLGVIAGIFFGTDGVGHGFVRTPDGRITAFDPPNAVGGVAGTYNAFINDFGVIAGSYYDANTNAEYGYLRWPDGQFTKFAAPKSGTSAFFGTELAAVNLLGTTTGWVFTNSVDVEGNLEFVAEAFVRDVNGNATTFVVPGQITTANPDLFGSAGAAINALGDIAGRWHDVNSAAHSFLRTR
jgi:hypothetical protein